MKKKTLRTIGLLCLLCIAIIAVIAYREYYRPHRSVETETAVTVTAKQLAAEYEKDETASNKKYLGRAVQVNGTVSEVSVNQQKKAVIFLTGSDMSGVQCSLLEEVPGIKKGDMVIIKGFCTGFLTDVIIDRCVMVH
jgi:CxxC motif-containing protein